MTRFALALLLTAALAGCKSDPAPTPPRPDAGPAAAAEPAVAADPAPMAPDAGAPPAPATAPPAMLDKDNPEIAAATFTTWNADAVAACDAAHGTELRQWIFSLCKAKLATETDASRMAGAAALPKLPLAFAAPTSKAIFLWNNHSTEVPHPGSIGGRKARFRDNPEDSSFHPEMLRTAAMANLVDLPVLAVDGTRPVAEVAEALEIFRAAGHKKVALAFDASSVAVAPPPDATGLDALQWQTAAPYMREGLKGCEPLSQVFKDFSAAPPESRCLLMGQRVPAAMLECKCEMADRHGFLRNLQLFITPPKFVTTVTIELSGKKVRVRGKQTWSEAAATLFASPRTQLLLEAR
jgi:hypothetical protein